VIGSGNVTQRSLYTDIEHGISFVDPDGDAVRRYRVQLWSHHLSAVDAAALTNLDAALEVWQSDRLVRESALEPLTLPLPEVALSRRQRRIYDAYHDCDSRRRWGGAIPVGLW
jgi:hypothetical protein